MYTWLVLVMGVFYTIPALQLVLGYQRELYNTGWYQQYHHEYHLCTNNTTTTTKKHNCSKQLHPQSNAFLTTILGNQDLCYYNFQCARPVRSITDFNHLFSNIGYVAFGFMFLILVK